MMQMRQRLNGADMADQIDVSGGVPGATGETAGGEKPHQFGLPAAMALIVGSIIGVGIFNLPTSLAFYGYREQREPVSSEGSGDRVA
jgi:hypothetical protein